MTITLALPTPPSAKRRRTYPEQAVHIAIVQALRHALPAGWMPIHVPNGGLRSKREAALLKAMGVLPGVPDIVILGRLDDRPFTAFMEVKAAKRGRLFDAQYDIHDSLRACGFPVAIVRSVDEALAQLDHWDVPLRATVQRRTAA